MNFSSKGEKEEVVGIEEEKRVDEEDQEDEVEMKTEEGEDGDDLINGNERDKEKPGKGIYISF